MTTWKENERRYHGVYKRVKVLMLLLLLFPSQAIVDQQIPFRKFLTKEEYLINECEKSIECRYLLQALYWEARGESDKGVVAVAYVILNRTKHPSWPSTVEGVVTQPWQFSYRMENNFQKGFTDKKQYSRIAMVAQKVLAMELKNPIGGATHYHATSIKAPKWTRKKRVVAVIGNHVFYE